MDSEKPSLLRRAIAVLVLVVVAVVAIRLVVGFVAGILSTLLWIVTAVVLVAALLWARSQLKAGKRERRIETPGYPAELGATPEDRVAAEMRRIQEQLRERSRP